MTKQFYIVQLSEKDGKNLYLAYDNMGRIGNACFQQAIRYDSFSQANNALKAVRRYRRWPQAQIFGVIDEFSDTKTSLEW